MSQLEEQVSKIFSQIAKYTCKVCIYTAYFYNLVFYKKENRLTKNVTVVPTV
jgi:hypothetical protein